VHFNLSTRWYMLISQTAEGVHGQRKVGNPWSSRKHQAPCNNVETGSSGSLEVGIASNKVSIITTKSR